MSAHDILASWTLARVGALSVRVHPALGHAVAESGAAAVALLGDPVDFETDSADAADIAQLVLGCLTADGEAAALRRVAYLGGRFACLVSNSAGLVVVPDCAASLPVFWHEADGVLTLSSYAHLVGELVGAPVNEDVKTLMRRGKEMGTPGTLYWPGVETPFLGVDPLLPNHCLTWVGGQGRHTRFYPFEDTQLETDEDRAYEQFALHFEQHTRLLCSLGRTGISLTAGLDSRATLTASLPHLTGDSLTWTYYNFDRHDRAMRADLLGANALAAQYGLVHRVIDLGGAADPTFTSAYQRTLRHTPQFRALAEAYDAQLPHDLVQLQSMVAEVGTGFWRTRTGGPDSVRLATLYSRSDFGALPAVRTAIERFVEYADFTPDRFGRLDFHDLFYWETRVGRWATLRMQECDLSHHLVLPYNARVIVESLMGPPLSRRVDKQALRRFIEERY